MNVLLVEDDQNKGTQLVNFIKDQFPDANIELVRSLQSAVRYIRKNHADIVLLDMTLPNYDAGPDEPGGGTTHSFGGREFLKQMERFQINVPVIVVTQFETFGQEPKALRLPELDAQLRRDHAPIYQGAVYYHASIHDWREKLRDAMKRALAIDL
ncbi:response regulator [Methylocystis sp. MJC1]|jgi:CheY-like chemotaxis protein|uniref:response regulator n=1 Tax=Methylocystis sp. MJC1 TaxID=2654282 RepID=UPI0013EC39A4|nr:response regulator [Methylocystis sp. MJC1]KAF2989831.1 hypothetical protein MJC1_03177 [Methylocystis sp. MJC1]MBU6526283.1 response regulator [Methylocystis sp. MJC1]UZX12737.1 response regulator [Methylocystis sp. MJC1]